MRAHRDASDSGFALALLVVIVTMLLSCAPDASSASDTPSISASVAAASSTTIRTDADTLQLANLQQKFQYVADSVAPCVVAISAAIDPVDSDDALKADNLSGEKLDALLDHVTRTVGTGFIISSDGYIATNEHVVGDAKQIWVTTDDRKVYPAMIVGSDPRADLAVLKIPARNLTAAKLAARFPQRGEWSITLGNPYGLAGAGEMAMSVGIISATDRSLPKLATRENRLYTNLLQTTAQINPGNSGGPLFDIEGNVIGINTAVVMPQKLTNGIGFALPITPELIEKFEQLKRGDEIAYGFIGVTVTTPTPRQKRDLRASGALVDSVELNSPADSAGMRVGDLILAIDDRLVRDSESFVRAIGDAKPSHTTEVLIRHAGEASPTTVKVTPRLRELPSSPVTKATRRFRWNGLLLGPATRGVTILEVAAGSAFASQSIAVGAIITSINDKPVSDLLDVQQIVNDLATDPVKLTFAAPAPAKQPVASVGD